MLALAHSAAMLGIDGYVVCLEAENAVATPSFSSTLSKGKPGAYYFNGGFTGRAGSATHRKSKFVFGPAPTTQLGFNYYPDLADIISK